MRAVMLEVPEYLLQERRRLGHDVRDEMWEGVLHMVPPPSMRHQELSGDLYLVLRMLAEAQGLRCSYETGVYASESDYKVVDIVCYAPEHRSQRGVEGNAALVVEIRSPGDETYDKLPFYKAVGCEQVLIIDRDTLEVDGGDGPVVLAALGATIERADSNKLVVRWDGGEREIVPA